MQRVYSTEELNAETVSTLQRYCGQGATTAFSNDIRDEIELIKQRIDLSEMRAQEFDARLSKQNSTATTCNCEGAFRDLEQRLTNLINSQGQEIAADII